MIAHGLSCEWSYRLSYPCIFQNTLGVLVIFMRGGSIANLVGFVQWLLRLAGHIL